MKTIRKSLLSLSIIVAFCAGVAAKTAFDGPTKGKGITLDTLAEIFLAKEIPDLQDRKFRMRKALIASGGIVPVHSHDGRPGLVYVMSGEIIEHRDDQDAPKVHRAGSFTVEAGGVTHWWENKGQEPVNLILVDVYK